MWKQNRTGLIINILITGLFASLLLLSACKKKNSDIGLDVVPESDRIHLTYTDTISLGCYLDSEDSFKSYGRSVGILGNYFDPVFGTANSSFMFQVLLSSGNVTFDDDSIGVPQADSLVLYLKLNDFYGDATTYHNLKAYKLNQSIFADSIYYSDINTSNYYSASDEICSMTISTSDIINNDSILKLTLPASLATEILETDISNLVDNATFLEFFKGIFITTESPYNTPGSVIYFDILLDESKMTLYYHDTQDTTEFDFVISSSCARINAFNHDYTGTEIESYIDNNTTSDSVVYLQGLGGVRTRMKFPFINNWRAFNGITINKAELIIPVEELETSVTDYELPNRLYLMSIADDNSLIAVKDDPMYNTNNDYFGGTYNSSSNSYKINITRYFQGLIAGEYSEKGLYIVPYYKAVQANRVVIKSNNHTNGLKLAVTYIKL